MSHAENIENTSATRDKYTDEFGYTLFGLCVPRSTANCQEARAMLSTRLREATVDVGVEVISWKVQDGVNHIHIAIGRDT